MPANPANRWKLGLFTLLGMGLVFLGLVWLGTAGLGMRSFRVVSYFDESVQGLDVGSKVKYLGVPIGGVTGIQIAPDGRHVAVTSEIDLDALNRLGFHPEADQLERGIFPLDLRVRLVSIGITGLKYLELDTFDPATLSTPQLPFEPAWNHLPAVPSLLKSAEDSLQDLIARFPDLETQARETLFVAENALETVRLVLEPFATGEAQLGTLTTELEQAARSLDAAAITLDGAMREAQVAETSTSIRNAANAVADAAYEATGLGAELREDLVALRELLHSMNALADTLERDPSALLRGRSESPEGP